MGSLLAVTGGHRFDAAAFAEMFDAVAAELGWTWEQAEHPEAQRWLRPEHAGCWDTIVLYDIPGLALARGAEPAPSDPSPALRADLLDLARGGQGIVALHHALAGWPTWDGYAELLGGRFLYRAGELHGQAVPASGYRMDRYTVDVAASDHPVCAGIDPFEVDDELYCCPVFEDEVEALLTTSTDVSSASMIDTHTEVVRGEQVPAPEQPGSRLLGWTRTEGEGRVVYLLPGHGPETMGHPMYRRLIANACRFVTGT